MNGAAGKVVLGAQGGALRAVPERIFSRGQKCAVQRRPPGESVRLYPLSARFLAPHVSTRVPYLPTAHSKRRRPSCWGHRLERAQIACTTTTVHYTLFLILVKCKIFTTNGGAL